MRSGEYSSSFTSIAPYYDTLMSFVNYLGWVDYIERILALHGSTKREIFDIACGTGVCMEHWYNRGYLVRGLDLSLDMLNVCRRRFLRLSAPGVELINGDIRYFAIRKKVPIITCLYDSLNYLLEENDLLTCFHSVYDALAVTGLFIFDMNTVHCLKDEWGNNTYFRQDQNVNSIWTNHFDEKSNVSSLDITLKIQENGNFVTVREFHQERGYTLSTITRMLADTGFKLSLYRHQTFTPAWEQDLRVMGVAEKC